MFHGLHSTTERNGFSLISTAIRKLIRTKWVLLASAAALAALGPGVPSASGQGGNCLPPGWQAGDAYPGINGSVNAAVMMPNGDIIAGGAFTQIGSDFINSIARWDGSAWRPLGSGLSSDGNTSVSTIQSLPNGDLLVAGRFNMAGGVTVNNIARWNGVSWSGGFGGGVDGFVASVLQLPNEEIIVGGSFTTVAGGTVAANRVARWNGAAWSALGAGVSAAVPTPPSVTSLTTDSNGHIIVGGRFTSAGPFPVNNIARWNGTTWSAMGLGVRNSPDQPTMVRGLTHLSNGDVIAVGTFAQAGNVSANNVARWNGTTWSALGSGVTGQLAVVSRVVARPNGNVAVGGSQFEFAGGVPVRCVAEWNGTTWSSVGATGVESGVGFLGNLASGDLLVAGSFNDIDNAPANRIGIWNGSTWSIPDPGQTTGVNGSVGALGALPNGDLVVGGEFTILGNPGATNIARRNLATGEWSGFGSGLAGAVSALTTFANGDVVVASTHVSGSSMAIMRWSEANQTWSQVGDGVVGSVEKIVSLPSGDLVIGGRFDNVGVVSVNNVALWNGSTWSSLATSVNAVVHALAVLPNGDLIVGGDFDRAGGVIANRVARWDGSAWSAMGGGIGSAFLPSVKALTVMPNGDVIAGGLFTSPGVNIARWNGSAWSNIGTGSGAVLSLAAMPDGDLIVGGQFTTFAGLTTNSVVKWNGTTWSAFGTGTNLNASVRDLTPVVAPGRIEVVLGGGFITVDGLPSYLLARYSFGPVAATITSQPQSLVMCPHGDASFAISASGAEPLSYQWRKDGIAIDSGANPSAITPTLLLSGVDTDDVASYDCVVTNDCGSTTSNAAMLSICAADFNCDGTANSGDFFVFITAFFNAEPSADINSDGAITSQDFFDFLGAFFAGC